MTPALEQLVREAMDLTGSERPALLEDDAPVLADEALSARDDEGFYLVGLIGGKDVGKSALINALVGKPITAVTSHGAGTEVAIAYVHRAQEPALRQLLEREVPEQYRIITHDQPALRRQVLLDLPDIDSRYAAHLQVTRTMLRHMLYPVWVSSVEKYADLQPQQMLAKVADGNTPANFVFCLTKADQLSGMVAAGEGFRGAEGSGFGVQGSGKEGVSNGAQRDTGVSPVHGASEVGEPGFTQQPHIQHGRDARVTLKRQPASVGTALTDAGPRDGATGASAEADPTPPHLNPEPRTLNPPPDPLQELREDYAARVQRTVRLPEPPRVFIVSSKAPDRFDMRALRELLCQQRTNQAVRESKELAAARQDRMLLQWLDTQQLPTRAQRLEQLERDAEDLIAARIGAPLMERIIPRILDDPGTRMAMADEILQDRVARWPVVNLVHTLLQPFFLLIRSAVSRSAAPMQSADGLVDACVTESGESFSKLVQSTFAQLRQQQPIVAALYGPNRLWESMPAELAAGMLHRTLADAVQRQRVTARQRLAVGRGAFLAPLRWIVTIGALLWFPFIQPILATALGDPTMQSWAWRRIAALLIDVLGVNYLLRSATFLILYYATLWLALRWNTQHRVGRLLARWRATDFPDPSVNLATQSLAWMDELIGPIRTARERIQSLANRIQSLRETTRAA